MLGPPEETRNPHRRCLGRTFAARATLGQRAYDGVGFAFQELFCLCAKFFTNEVLTPPDGVHLLFVVELSCCRFMSFA
jgi:hypothetical protein